MQRARLPLLLSSVLFLGACGTDESGPASGVPGADADAAVPAQTEPVAPVRERTATDGWADLHDIPLPDPGRAVLTIGEQEYAVDITCEGPGEYDPDHHMANLYLFRVSFDGKGETQGGQGFWLFGNRHVTTLEAAAGTHQEQSQVTLAVDVPDNSSLRHSTIAISPSDADPTGAGLPLLHVSPDGGFTMRAPMERGGSIHEHAPEGEAVLAARCPDGW